MIIENDYYKIIITFVSIAKTMANNPFILESYVSDF